MFTGVVVENFSYVLQTSGGAKAITREEMRAFKKVWAEFANARTGYLERERFVPFFAVRFLPLSVSSPLLIKGLEIERRLRVSHIPSEIQHPEPHGRFQSRQ